MRTVLFISALALASTAHARLLEKLIMDGDHEPVTGATMKFGSSITTGNGKVFAGVTLSGAGITTANDTAWVYGDVAAPRLLLREGDPIPGFPGQKIGGVYGFVGPTGWYGAEALATGVANGQTFVTCASTIIGNGITSQVVAKTGDLAPELSTTIQSVRPTYVRSDTEFGLGVFLTSPVGTRPQPYAEYRAKSDGSLQLMFTNTESMPQLPPDHLSQLITHSLHNAGRSLWTLAYLAPGYSYGSGRQGLFLSTDRGNALVVKDGDPQPVSPPSGAYIPVAMWLGADGSYVYESGFLDDTDHFYGIGIYSGNESGSTLRRLPSQVFTDQPGRSVLTIDQFDSNPSGLIVLSGSTSKFDFSDAHGVIGLGNADQGFHTLAMSGDPAPGLDGVTFTAFSEANQPSNAWINDVGDVAFFATLGGAGIDSSNDRSIWLYDHTGLRDMLLREGDPFIYDGATRIVSTITGSGSTFDDAGRLTLSLTFTDGTRGLFLATVPEPTGLTAAAVTLALGFLARRRRSSQQRQDR